jgi:hypothetical protein
MKKYIFFLLLIVGCIYFIESNRTPPFNWRSQTYNTTDTNPFGTYLLNQEIDSLVKNDSIIRFTENIYEWLNNTMYDTIGNVNLLSIRGSYYFDYSSSSELTRFLKEGNTAIIIQQYFYFALLDTLGIQQGYLYDSDDSNQTVELTNPKLSTQNFSLKGYNNNYFIIPDSMRNSIEVLSFKKTEDDKKLPILIKIPIGKGHLYLGTEPVAFTNYNLLHSNNHLYAEGILSYLPNQKTYFPVDALDGQSVESQSILRFVLQNKALRWAWYMFLITLLTFTFFTAKRKQRIIPIITPLKNTTVDFTKTVSNLYIQNKDYNDIAQKSIIYTLEKIRRQYGIETSTMDKQFVEKVHLKTDKSIQDIENFIAYTQKIRNNNHIITESDLIALNKLIEKITD